MELKKQTVVIADGATESTPIFTGGDYGVRAIKVPTGFEGTTLTFKASLDGGETFQVIHDLDLEVAAGEISLIDIDGFDAIVIVAASQTGAATLTVALS